VLHLDIESRIKFDDARPAVHALADSGHARLMLVCLRAGQTLKDHHSSSQVHAHFLRGRARFYADGLPQEAGAGTIVLLEANHFHRIEAVEDTVVLVTMAPHPAREGYPRDEMDRIVPRSGPNA
jgi:quercetin dioxygenase-like cupin family protein